MRIVPAGLLAQLAQCGELRIDLVEARPYRAEQAFARFRRRDAAGGARQQAKSEPLFEAPDGVAERGLRDAELGGGVRETALARDGQEGQEVTEMSAMHL